MMLPRADNSGRQSPESPDNSLLDLPRPQVVTAESHIHVCVLCILLLTFLLFMLFAEIVVKINGFDSAHSKSQSCGNKIHMRKDL